jgi:hypothetical protein
MWWFKKAKPAPPSIEDEEKLVKWLLRYADDFQPLRRPYAKNIDGFVDVNWRSMKKEIEEHDLRSPDALMMRAGEIAEYYEKNFKPLVDRSGGIDGCRPEFQAGAVMMLVKISVMLYLAKHKYGAPIPEDLLGMTKL